MESIINGSIRRIPKVNGLKCLPIDITNILLLFDLRKLTFAVLKPLVNVIHELVVKFDSEGLVVRRFIGFGLLGEAQGFPIILIYFGPVKRIANILDSTKYGG